MSRSARLPLALSIAAHVAALSPLWATRNQPTLHDVAPAQLENFAQSAQKRSRAIEIQFERQLLVEDARGQRDRKELALGAFLLKGNALDAEEASLAFDYEAATQKYEARKEQLAEESRKSKLPTAVATSFADLRYIGRPGGLMGDALLNGGGSCEQISQLVVASAFDAGFSNNIELRYYGGRNTYGITHLAPVFQKGKDAVDLSTGNVAHKGGVRIKPEELVEIYARSHGLAPSLRDNAPPDSDGGKMSASISANAVSIESGLPANTDAYPGRIPLYAAHAIQQQKAPTLAGTEPSVAPDESMMHAKRCGYFLRLAVLKPLTIEVVTETPSLAALELEPRRIPTTQRLEAEAELLDEADEVLSDPKSNQADRLMAFACAAALSEMASVDFALSGQQNLANQLVLRSNEARKSGDQEMAKVRWANDEGAQVRKDLSEYAGRTWLLQVLEGGDQVSFELAERNEKQSWGHISTVAGLLVYPPTRKRAIETVERLSLDDQIDVMHEVYHAHDHMKPWVSDFVLESPSQPDSSFLKVYRVFRSLAWRLWEERSTPDQILEGLHADVQKFRVESVWEAALLEYTSRNLLGLLAARSDDIAPVKLLRAAVQQNGHPSGISLLRRLEFLESKGKLDAMSMAEAWRMK